MGGWPARRETGGWTWLGSPGGKGDRHLGGKDQSARPEESAALRSFQMVFLPPGPPEPARTASCAGTAAAPGDSRGSPLTAARPASDPALPQQGVLQSAENGQRPANPSRKRRSKPQRRLVRPRCAEHDRELLVGRTVGAVQYRYCPVPGCCSAETTFRGDAPHKRWPPDPDSPRRTRSSRSAPPGGQKLAPSNPGEEASGDGTTATESEVSGRPDSTQNRNLAGGFTPVTEVSVEGGYPGEWPLDPPEDCQSS